MKRKLLYSIIIAAGFFLIFNLSFAVKLSVQFPGQPKEVKNLNEYISILYKFALGVVGLFAFGSIVFGAIQYTASAGNVSKQQDAKDRITQAIYGTVLLLAAVLILNTINPSILLTAGKFELEKIKPPEVAKQEPERPREIMIWRILSIEKVVPTMKSNLWKAKDLYNVANYQGLGLSPERGWEAAEEAWKLLEENLGHEQYIEGIITEATQEFPSLAESAWVQRIFNNAKDELYGADRTGTSGAVKQRENLLNNVQKRMRDLKNAYSWQLKDKKLPF